ncbi:hypothetical protein HGI30_19545 [Paenibacillus albicereus]|uniref:Polymer-forming cytoskeletal protein n=1 Tax=Paenibacillus albicereus TaxID=2726185 RepID=A0A6H2H1J7_9BACL|nr:hypothetical protein [Paenibacillus albicereus]QJC53515.1 hypothetical protein HGI30_19545 [Paenibacillus albicereus]
MAAKTESAARRLSLTGTGVSGGGSYAKARVIGDGIVHGSLDCVQLAVTGSLRVHGELNALNARVTGTVSAEGLSVGRLRLTGELVSRDAATVRELLGSGSFASQESLQADCIRLSGELQATSCSASEVRIKGRAAVPGKLDAGSIMLQLHRDSSIGELVGRRVEVSRPGWLARLFGTVFRSVRPARLDARRIEGAVVRLERTRADTVRGGSVTIGEGCEIGRVDYTEELTVHPGAVVKERRRM